MGSRLSSSTPAPTPLPNPPLTLGQVALAAGADPCSRYSTGLLPCAASVTFGQPGADVVERALRCPGVRVDRTGFHGDAAVHEVARTGNVGALQAILRAGGASVLEARNADGCTAFLLAVLHGHVHAAEVLVEAGSDPLAATNNGETAAHLAGTPAMLSRVCAWGASVNSLAKAAPGSTLWSALRDKRFDVLEALVQAGARLAPPVVTDAATSGGEAAAGDPPVAGDPPIAGDPTINELHIVRDEAHLRLLVQAAGDGESGGGMMHCCGRPQPPPPPPPPPPRRQAPT
jgi:hypothetical protein